jgi:hypothetical protein
LTCSELSEKVVSPIALRRGRQMGQAAVPQSNWKEGVKALKRLELDEPLSQHLASKTHLCQMQRFDW